MIGRFPTETPIRKNYRRPDWANCSDFSFYIDKIGYTDPDFRRMGGGVGAGECSIRFNLRP